MRGDKMTSTPINQAVLHETLPPKNERRPKTLVSIHFGGIGISGVLEAFKARIILSDIPPLKLLKTNINRVDSTSGLLMESKWSKEPNCPGLMGKPWNSSNNLHCAILMISDRTILI